MLIHSKWDRSRFLYEASGCTEWIAVWSDDARAEAFVVKETLKAGNVEVRIGKRICAN